MKAWKKTVSILLALVLLVSIIPLSAITANAAPESYEEILPGQSKKIDEETDIFRFTPKESGWYCFSTSGVDIDTVCEMYLYDSDYDEENQLDYRIGEQACEVSLAYFFDGGETYYLEVVSPSEFEPYFVTAEKMVLAEGVSFAEGGSGAAYIGTSFYLNPVFEPENAIYEEGEWISSNEKVATVDERGEVCAVAKGKTTITYTTENGLTAKYQLTVTQIPSISAGESKTVNITRGGEKVYFAFTPKESGYYRYYLDDAYWFSNYRGEILDSDMELLENGYGFDIEYQFTAAETYYLSAYIYDRDETGSFTFTLEKMTPATSVVISYPEKDPFVTYKGMTRSFYAELSPEDCSPEDFSWKSSDKKVATVDEDGCVDFVGAGSAVITVTTENGLTAKRNIKVIEPAVIRAGETKTVSLSGNEDECVFSFTPKTDGYYDLTSDSPDDSADISVRTADNMYADFNDFWYDNDGVCHEQYCLSTDESYFIRIASCSPVSFRLSLDHAAKATAVTISGGNPIKGYIGESIYPSVKYSPEHAVDDIKSTVSDNPSVASVDEDMADCIHLNAHGTANVTFTTVGGLKTTCTVTVLDNRDLDELKIGKTAAVNNISENNSAYFRFTPSTSGAYLFTSEEDPEKVISADLFGPDDESWSSLFDDNGFYLKEKLTAGTTYVLKVQINSSEPVSCKVKVEKSRSISSLELVSPPKNKTYIPDIYESIDCTGLSVRLRWDDGTSTVWTYSDDEDSDNTWIEYEYLSCNTFDDGLINVRYDDKEIEYQLTKIENPVDHIVINTAPTKVYTYGELPYFGTVYFADPECFFNHPDLTGLVFTVYFKDGSEKRYTWKELNARENEVVGGKIITYTAGGYTVYVYSEGKAVVGDNTLTLEYMNNQATYTAKVNPSPVESIEIVKGPDNPVFDAYYCAPDMNGLTLRINYTDGSSKVAAVSDYNPYDSEFTIDGYHGRIVRSKSNDYRVDYLGCYCMGKDLKTTSGKKDVKSIHVTDLDKETGKMTLMLTWTDNTVETLRIDEVVLLAKAKTSRQFFGRTPYGFLYCIFRENPDGNVKVTAFGCSDTFISSEPSKQYILGDADGDGDVTILDATRIQRFLAELVTDDDGIIRKCGDADCDGDVTILDATAIQRFLAEMKVDHPIGQPIA